MRTCKLGDFSRRSANAAANIQDLHIFLDADGARKIVLMPDDALSEGLAEGGAVEVEALAEAEFVEVGGEIVVPAVEFGLELAVR